MHNWQFKLFHKPLLVFNQHHQVIKVPLMPNIMLIEVQLLWRLVIIKKLCTISVRPLDLMISNRNIMQIEEIV